MSNNLNWTQSNSYEPGIDRLRGVTESLSPGVTKPTESHLQEFADVIENVIVPRLLMSHAQTAVQAKTLQQRTGGTETEKITVRNVGVSDFVAQTMQDDPDCAVNYVRHLIQRGVKFQDVLLELMAPAARILGEMWEQDKASFAEVALGVARMHRILREFDGVPSHLWSNAGVGRHTLLLPTPGENHTFGLRLVQEFMLRESWTVTNKLVEDTKALALLVAREHFDVVGLSLSGETLIDTFLSSIRVIRSESMNRKVRIIVGGHCFLERPELIDTCGSDGYAVDAPDTVRIVNRWANQLSAAT